MNKHVIASRVEVLVVVGSSFTGRDVNNPLLALYLDLHIARELDSISILFTHYLAPSPRLLKSAAAAASFASSWSARNNRHSTRSPHVNQQASERWSLTDRSTYVNYTGTTNNFYNIYVNFFFSYVRLLLAYKYPCCHCMPTFRMSWLIHVFTISNIV